MTPIRYILTPIAPTVSPAKEGTIQISLEIVGTNPTIQSFVFVSNEDALKLAAQILAACRGETISETPITGSGAIPWPTEKS